MKQVVIIGNGVSGITAARHIRKGSPHKITVISSETPYFFSRTALMYVYMGHLTFEHLKPYEDTFWKKNRIDLLLDHVVRIDFNTKTLKLRSGKEISYDSLIIATGSSSNKLQAPGEDLPGVQGLYSHDDLSQMEMLTRGIEHAVVVGGGLIGVEMAEMLCSRKIHVTMVIREAAFWNNVLPIEEAQMISRHIASHGVDILHERELSEIVVGPDKNVKAIRTRQGDTVPAKFVGIAVGVHPNIQWLKDSGLSVRQGILVNEFLETNIPDVYAIGDCVERLYSLEGRKNIEQVWYTARMMGEAVAQTICGDKTPYRPGPWFNSAKFFDIEYQAYGNVPSSSAPDEQDFYWEHASGRKAIHLVWKKKTNGFVGINSFGIRLRHENFDRWLREKKSVQYVVDHLNEANFDPEFTERYEKEIRDQFFKKDIVTERA
jgi:NADH oxidase (H2O2-forming)